MKKLIQKSAIVASFILAISVSNQVSAYANNKSVNNQETFIENELVFMRNCNPVISIHPDVSAIGYDYKIADKNGKIIQSGKIKSGKTIEVNTENLENGSYQLSVGGYKLQQFTIK